MTAMARHFDNLGPDFDQRWKRSSRGTKRELIGELRELYIFLEEEDMPLLAGHSATQPPAEADKAKPGGRKKPAIEQGTLFSDSSDAASALVATDDNKSKPAGAPRKDNPFLPQSVLDRLHDSQNQASAGLRELMQTTPAAPVRHDQMDLERELRLKFGPVVESLIDAQMEQLKSELRVRLRAEMDRLIAEHIRKS